jgi:hypothetical protein
LKTSEIFSELSHALDQEKAAEIIHDLRKNGEQFLYNEGAKRLIIGREWNQVSKGIYETEFSSEMTRISRVLNIHSRKSFEEADYRFNLTMY